MSDTHEAVKAAKEAAHPACSIENCSVKIKLNTLEMAVRADERERLAKIAERMVYMDGNAVLGASEIRSA